MPLLIALLMALAVSAGMVTLNTPEPRISQRLTWAQSDLMQGLSCNSAASCDDVALKAIALSSVGRFDVARRALGGIPEGGSLWVLAVHGYWTASADEAFVREQWPRLAMSLFAPRADHVINDGALELAAADAILNMAREFDDSITVARVDSIYPAADRRAQAENGIFGAAFGLINADHADAEITFLADNVHARYPIATGLMSLALYEHHREGEAFALVRGMATQGQSTSSMYVLALMRGLLGWEVDAPNRAISIEPHLPAAWTALSASGLIVGRDTLIVALRRDQGVYSIHLRRTRSAPALSVQLSPALPRGARIRGIKANDADVPVQVDTNKYDTHAIVELTLRREVNVEIEYVLPAPRRSPR